MVGAHRVRESPTQNPLISVLWSPDLVDFFRVDGWWSQAKELDAAFGRKKYSLILMMVWSLRILGPSNGRVWTCIAGVWVLKIATFEGSGFLGIYVFVFCLGKIWNAKRYGFMKNPRPGYHCGIRCDWEELIGAKKMDPTVPHLKLVALTISTSRFCMMLGCSLGCQKNPDSDVPTLFEKKKQN